MIPSILHSPSVTQFLNGSVTEITVNLTL